MRLKLSMGLMLFGLGVLPVCASVTPEEIQDLQNQINCLQASIHGVAQKQAFAHLISLDTQNPFGGMPDTTMPLVFLKAQHTTLSTPVVLGGELETDTQFWDGSYTKPHSAYTNGTGSGVYVTTASLYAGANMNSWSQALIELGTSGSQMSVPLAFINLGNLSKTPFYVTVGDTYLPFGVFKGNGPWANTLTTNLFRMNSTKQVALGWDYNDLNANLAAYESGFTSNLNGYVLNLLYNQSLGNLAYSLGASYMTDVRGTSAAMGSAYSSTRPSLSQPLSGGPNPAVDLNASLNWGAYGLMGEYISTLSDNVNADNTPLHTPMSTWDIGGTYNFNLMSLPSMYLISYSATDHMRDVPMPLNGSAGAGVSSDIGIRYQWLSSIDIQVFNNVYLGPEVAYDQLYNNKGTTTATIDFTAFF